MEKISTASLHCTNLNHFPPKVGWGDFTPGTWEHVCPECLRQTRIMVPYQCETCEDKGILTSEPDHVIACFDCSKVEKTIEEITN